MTIPFFICFFVSSVKKPNWFLPKSPNRILFLPVNIHGYRCIPVLQYAAGYFDQLLSLIKPSIPTSRCWTLPFKPVTQYTDALIVQFICTTLLAAVFEEFAFRAVI
jgi:membrane protease YdiL (CAAX protease family)